MHKSATHAGAGIDQYFAWHFYTIYIQALHTKCAAVLELQIGYCSPQSTKFLLDIERKAGRLNKILVVFVMKLYTVYSQKHWWSLNLPAIRYIARLHHSSKTNFLIYPHLIGPLY